MHSCFMYLNMGHISLNKHLTLNVFLQLIMIYIFKKYEQKD